MQQRTLLLTMALVLAGAAAHAGSLTPPGAPASTMKPLSQVEGRTPITSLPYTINTPGSYYLAQSLKLTTVDTDGITINSGNVTLDLNGYALIGPGKTAGTTGDAVDVAIGAMHNIAVCNGSITGWSGSGIEASGTINAQMTALRVTQNGSSGILAGHGSCLVDITAAYNGLNGLVANSYSAIRGNAIHNNGGAGMLVNRHATIADNTCCENTTDGISVDAFCRISGNTCSNNGDVGIDVGIACLIENNVAVSNDTAGIRCAGASRVVGNMLFSNTQMTTIPGIYIDGEGNTVQNNLLVANDVGIKCSASAKGNYIGSNQARNNTTAYDLTGGGGNTIGSGDLANLTL